MQRTNRFWSTVVIASLATFVSTCQAGPPSDGYDVVILHGRVMDPETGFDAITNVGISDGVITAITDEAITGTETIDATGHVVSPGFIDSHFHGASNPFTVKLGLRDGVTTPLDAEGGVVNVDAWYAEFSDGWQTNYGAFVGHELHRLQVMDGIPLTEVADGEDMFGLRARSVEDDNTNDWSVTVASIDQLNEILTNIDRDLQAGALGVVMTVGYAIEGVSTFELWNSQKLSAAYSRTFGGHVRFHGSGTPPMEGSLGFLEVMANAAALNGPTLLSHNNSFGWWGIEERAQMMRANGFNIWSEYYPYAAASTNIGAVQILPENIAQSGIDYTNLYNPTTSSFMDRAEYDRIVAEDPGFIIVGFQPQREAWMPLWLRVPEMVVGGDGMMALDAEGNRLGWDDPYESFSGHPRTAGTHGRVLRMGRENGVPLMFTLSQLSYWSAKHLGDAGIEAMQVRGRMQESMVADITIFDPETVTDNADYALGTSGLPTTGIPFVVVNGTVVVRDSEVIRGVNPGQAIRYPVESEGRFEPLDPETYVEDTALGGVER
jgi:hypothetical protein